MRTLPEEHNLSQWVSASDIRLLLICSLSLLLLRVRHGIRVTSADLNRPYADPPRPDSKGQEAAA
jgi:hypothetical protein